MHHEIIGPEMTVITGQLRIPKREAIAQHIAQYSTPSTWNETERKRFTEENTTAKKIKFQLEALEFTNHEFGSRKIIEKNLEALGIPNALADNWIARDQILRFQKLKNEARTNNVTISIPFLENGDLKTLESEMDGMLKILKLPDAVHQVIRKCE